MCLPEASSTGKMILTMIADGLRDEEMNDGDNS